MTFCENHHLIDIVCVPKSTLILLRPIVSIVISVTIFCLHQALLKQARQRKFEEQQRMKELWAQKSQQIDQWQERHRAKIKEDNLVRVKKMPTFSYSPYLVASFIMCL